jgi:hypothetical protein
MRDPHDMSTGTNGEIVELTGGGVVSVLPDDRRDGGVDGTHLRTPGVGIVGGVLLPP